MSRPEQTPPQVINEPFDYDLLPPPPVIDTGAYPRLEDRRTVPSFISDEDDDWEDPDDNNESSDTTVTEVDSPVSSNFPARYKKSKAVRASAKKTIAERRTNHREALANFADKRRYNIVAGYLAKALHNTWSWYQFEKPKYETFHPLKTPPALIGGFVVGLVDRGVFFKREQAQKRRMRKAFRIVSQSNDTENIDKVVKKYKKVAKKVKKINKTNQKMGKEERYGIAEDEDDNLYISRKN